MSKIDFKKMGVILTAGFLLAFKPSMILTPIKGLFNSIMKLFKFGNNNNNGDGGGFDFKIPNVSTVLKAIADIGIIIVGESSLILAYGWLSTVPGFSAYMSGGAELLAQVFMSVAKMSIGLGALVLITGVAAKLGSPMNFLKGMTSVAIILGGFAIIFEAFGLLTEIPNFSQFMSTGAQTLSRLTDGMSAFSKPSFLIMVAGVAALGMLSPATVLSGMAGVAIIIGGMGLIIAAFAALNEIPGFADFMARGCDVLIMLSAKIGEMIGSFAGGIISGVGVGLTQSLIDMGKNLSEFSEELKPFFVNISGYPVDAVAPFLDSLGSFLLKMSAEELMSWVAGDTDYTELVESLNTFASKASNFFNTVATYPDEGLSKAPLYLPLLKI